MVILSQNREECRRTRKEKEIKKRIVHKSVELYIADSPLHALDNNNRINI